MTNDEAYRAALRTFQDAWDTITPTVPPVKFPNVALSPTLQATIDAGATAWARISWKPNTRKQTAINGSVGNRLFTQTGIMIVEVYTPSGDGCKLDRTLTRLVERAFEGISTLNGLWFRNVGTNPGEADGTMWHSNVIIPWEYQEIR